MKRLVILSLLAILGTIPFAFPQTTQDVLIQHLRMTHSSLSSDIGEVISLIEKNQTSEALGRLEGMNLRIDHMNIMFNDLVWEMSNKGH